MVDFMPHDQSDAENMDAARTEFLFDRDFGTAGMEDDGDDGIEYVEYDYDDDGEYGNTVYHGLDDDEGDFDPNRCPSCGGDLTFGMCPDVSCLWSPADDEDEDDYPNLCVVCGGTGVDQKWARENHWDGRDDEGLPKCAACGGNGTQS